MVIGGFQKTSLSDFPGAIAAILFTRGCGFRCPYCHNPQLVDPARFGPAVPWSQVKSYLQSRVGRIEGVVVTGGEPTVHNDLPDLLSELSSMGFRIKLDTNGSNPTLLQRVVADGLVDFLALDIKAPLDLYDRAAGTVVDTEAVRSSVEIVRESGIPYELRTTFVPAVCSIGDLLGVIKLIRGCPRYVIQAFRPGKTLDPRFASSAAPTEAQLKEAASRFAAAGIPVEIR